MTPIESLIEPLRHSPRLPEVIDRLSQILSDERRRRQQFYAEMSPDQKVEFIDGEVILHSPARLRHLTVTKYILKLLDAYVEQHDRGIVVVEKSLCVFPRNDYEPDIVYFGPAKAAMFEATTVKFPPPDLAVEVLSESTEARDRGVKFDDYAASGVGEYWMIDADKIVVEQYLLRQGNYQLQMKSGTGNLTSEVIVGLSINVAAFFDKEANIAELRRLGQGPN